LLRELRLLERHTHRSGKDTVDHPRNGRDDHANAVCGVLRQLSNPLGFDVSWNWVSGSDDPLGESGSCRHSGRQRRSRDPAPPARAPRWGFGGAAGCRHDRTEDLIARSRCPAAAQPLAYCVWPPTAASPFSTARCAERERASWACLFNSHGNNNMPGQPKMRLPLCSSAHVLRFVFSALAGALLAYLAKCCANCISVLTKAYGCP
jgi:hypothetical protein